MFIIFNYLINISQLKRFSFKKSKLTEAVTQRCFVIEGILKYFAKFTGKHARIFFDLVTD